MCITEEVCAAYDRMHTPIHQRRTNTEVIEAIPVILQQAKGMTYNAVAKRLDIHHGQAGSLLQYLANKPESPVYVQMVRKEVRSSPMYHYAPERKQLDACPEKRKQLIRGVVVDFLTSNPGSSKIVIKRAVVDRFVKLDIMSVHEVLEDMIAKGEVDVTDGARGARLISLW